MCIIPIGAAHVEQVGRLLAGESGRNGADGDCVVAGQFVEDFEECAHSGVCARPHTFRIVSSGTDKNQPVFLPELELA